ncbi:uncharacterized protein LOC107037150 [Diachasma alloeum]|uniref:uncharacterized protein LOC107037150 n=1 Tax=Diachasma alloeum TaxID=454923 RepID=UPI0007382E21|nr:uncharacterized protein LOC107037150 [Diachasma alloeum]
MILERDAPAQQQNSPATVPLVPTVIADLVDQSLLPMMTPEQQQSLLVEGMAQIGRVALQLGEFTPEDPELFFSIADRSFHAAGITSEATKFGHICGKLFKSKHAFEVRDIILNLPLENSYTHLKMELIKCLSSSQEEKTRRLLEGAEMRNMKPSHFLHHLRNLAGASFPDDTLRTLWITRLPADVQALLATQRNSALEDAAELADKTIQILKSRIPPVAPQIAETSAHGIEALLSLKLSQLALTLDEKLNSMRDEIESLKRTRRADRGHPGGGGFRRSRSRSRSKHRQPGIDGPCWYHWRFGHQARTCMQPCNFATPGNGTSSH